MRKTCIVCKQEKEIERGIICQECLCEYKSVEERDKIQDYKNKILEFLPEYKKRLAAFEHFLQTGEIIDYSQTDFERLARYCRRACGCFNESGEETEIEKLKPVKCHDKRIVEILRSLEIFGVNSSTIWRLNDIDKGYINGETIWKSDATLKEQCDYFNKRFKFSCKKGRVGMKLSQRVAKALIENGYCEDAS